MVAGCGGVVVRVRGAGGVMRDVVCVRRTKRELNGSMWAGNKMIMFVSSVLQDHMMLGG